MTNKIVAIQGDNLKKINIKTDTTIFLAHEAQNKGYKLFYYYPENLSNIRGKTVSEGYFIKIDYSKKKFYKIIKKSKLDLSFAKYILIRQDPPFNLEYISTTLMLDRIKDKTKIINDPTSVRNISEKFYSLNFKNYMADTIFTKDLIEIKKNLNKGNQKLVMTNGCFDILHAGHVSYLSKARESGDFLVIALNSDKSVKRLKGKNRPINNLKNRISVLSSLKFVDGIVVFDQDTPIELYKKITPDILCKGADYSIKNIIGADIVKKKGGRVLRINYVDGLSTSNILRGLNDW